MAIMPEVLSLDFETFYSNKEGYTLSKMTTEEYIRDPRFEPLMVGIHAPTEGPESAYTVIHHKPDIEYKLSNYDWDNTIVLHWNAHFDAAILAWHYGIRPKAIFCVMQMWKMMGLHVHGGASLKKAIEYGKSQGWPLIDKGEEVIYADGKRYKDFTQAELSAYARYCKEDAKNTYIIFEQLMARGFPMSELFAMSEFIRCFSEPRLVLKTDVLLEVKKKKDDAMAAAMELAGVEDIKMLRSDEKLAEIFRRLGHEPETKLNKNNEEKYAFAKTDEAMQELIEHEDDTIAAIAAARLATKSTITVSRSQRLIDISRRGRWPVMLQQGVAHTLRLSGGDKTNPQNLSKKDGTRDGVTVPDGFVLIGPDKSQIEARFVAYLAGQWDLVEDFRSGTDVYCKFGNESGVFQIEITKKTVDERFVCKGVVLGGGFGAGAAAMERQIRNLAFSLGLTVNLDVDYSALNKAYRELYPKIKVLWKQMTTSLRALINGVPTILGTDDLIRFEIDSLGPCLRLPNGLAIYYHNLREEIDEETGQKNILYDQVRGRGNKPTRIHGAKATENIVQALSALNIREDVVRIVKRGRKEFGVKYGPVVLQIHDQLIAMVRKQVAAEYGLMMQEEMSRPPVWAPRLPVAVETAVGDTLGKVK